MRTLVFWCGFAFNCNAASLCAPETPTFISISAFRSNHFVPGLVVICRLKPCCFSEVDLSCVLLFALWMEYSGSFFPPDLSKAELCSGSASGHVMRKKSEVLSLRYDMRDKIWLAATHLVRKSLLLLQHYSNTFHSDNEVFMQAPNQVTSYAVTSLQARHNPLKWQALKSALVVINFKNPLTPTVCCESNDDTNAFSVLYCSLGYFSSCKCQNPGVLPDHKER